MDVLISNLPSRVEARTVDQAIVNFVSSNKDLAPLTYSCLSHIRVKVDRSLKVGKGVLIFSTFGAGRQFLSLFAFHGFSMWIRGSEIYFSQISAARQPFTTGPSRVPSEKVIDICRDLRVLGLQFGVLYRPNGFNSKVSRSYSVEWEKKFLESETAWLGIESALLRIRVDGSLNSLTMTTFTIAFQSIRKLAMGYDDLCFDLEHPSTIEESAIYLSLAENRPVESQRPKKRRVGYFHDGLTGVASFAYHIRVLLFKDNNVDVISYLNSQLTKAGLDAARVVNFTGVVQVDAHKGNLYSHRQLFQLNRAYVDLSWAIVFQLESLLRNGVFHAAELSQLAAQVRNTQASPRHSSLLVVTVLRELCHMSISGNLREPLDQCFSRLYAGPESIDPAGSDTFLCHYITFTPTRSILRGPFPTRSNRIIRKYPGFEDRFIRVAFRDEDLLPYRESSDVDVGSLIRERVGSILSQGFDLGGRHYDFLGYSMAGFRNHSVWFMSSFAHSDFGDVTPDKVRSSLGNFGRVLKYPSMYGARLAQAFTSTVPTVLIGPEEWELVDDLGSKPYQFTDGAGTISRSLGREIWNILRSKGLYDGLEPSAEFKGMLSVDTHLDEHGGVRMRLRKSMKKFETAREAAELEIVQAFDRPRGCYLNRPLVLTLENLGVEPSVFVELQQKAVSDILDGNEFSEPLHRMMEDRHLGHAFRLSSLIKQTMQLVRRSEPHEPQLADRLLASSIVEKVAHVMKSTFLQDIKYGARVPIPGSFLLVGVPDEGPVYRKHGQTNVFALNPGQIYACVQYPEEVEATVLSGPFLIFRSPVMHPGDIQRVHAIGRPPEDMFCAFTHLKNVVVLPSIGKRSLASCLGGGDLDGDRRLSEAEVVAGTILSRDWPKQYRKQRIDQMNVHAAALVRDVRRALHAPCDQGGAGRDELLRALGSGWKAWNYVSSRDGEEGVGSFGLIVLGATMYTGNRSPSPFPESARADRALLLATVSSLDPPHFLAPAITAAASSTRAHLTIVLFSRHFNDPRPKSSVTFRGVSRTDRFEDVCRLLTCVYVQATSVAQSLDKVLMEIDVLLLGLDEDVPCTLGKNVDVVFRVSGDSIPVPLPSHLTSLRQSYLTAANHDSFDAPVSASPSSPSFVSTIPAGLHKPSRLPVVALGGTFDHLHAGHKILLSMAAWITSEKIIVGVTDDVLLKKKSNPHLLQPLAERIERVRAFLELSRPGIEYEIVPIQDVYGPTGWDPNVQGLVVSQETVSGAEARRGVDAEHEDE
ncbi:hypothetical protein C0993_010961 [Termitomyces sp. T159_Od127]|nr:hypothetical protein C0993_010961 [Termitomyces sp. T159_Od127]